MKITDILRKLGVFRGGSVSWKGKASERPIEAIMDDVYDAEKDLVHGVFKGTKKSTGPAADHQEAGKKISRTGRLLPFLALALGIFVLFIMAVSGYFGLWFWANGVLWLVFTGYARKAARRLPYATGKTIGVLLLLSLVSFFSLSAIPTDRTKLPDLPPLDAISRVDLALDLESDLGLEDVMIDVLDGGVLEVRTKTPVNVSSGAIYGASAFIFGYLEPRLPQDIRHLRIMLTVNDLDAMFIETTRDNVRKRQAGKMDDTVFFNSLRTVNVGVAEK